MTVAEVRAHGALGRALLACCQQIVRSSDGEPRNAAPAAPGNCPARVARGPACRARRRFGVAAGVTRPSRRERRDRRRRGSAYPIVDRPRNSPSGSETHRETSVRGWRPQTSAPARPARLQPGAARSRRIRRAYQHGSPCVHAARPAHRDVRAQIDRAVAEVRAAEDRLADLQDSVLPVEVGDPELPAAVADVRGRLGGVARNARELTRVLGR